MTTELIQSTWTTICTLDDLEPEWGESALVDDHQLALFRLWDNRVIATSNLDPRTGSAVMSRGIVGTRSGIPTITSPLHKECYNLLTGECFGDPDLRLDVYSIRIDGSLVSVSTPVQW